MATKRWPQTYTTHIKSQTVSATGYSDQLDVSTLSVRHGEIKTEFSDLTSFNNSIFREVNHDELKRLLLQCLIMLSPIQRYGFNEMTFEQIFEEVKKRAEGEEVYVDMKEGKE